MGETNLKLFEELIDYKFKDQSLLKKALTHTSYSNESGEGHLGSYERLEFLGDAVLELISSDFFFKKYPNYEEGRLTKIRASFVCEPTLAECAARIHLSEFLFLGKGEDATGGRTRASIISDSFEAVIGAIYIDGGLANAKDFIYDNVLLYIDEDALFYDSKTILQERAQRLFGMAPEYELIGEEGPDHEKVFTAQVSIDGKVKGRGKGSTKKTAEQNAAKSALSGIK